MNPYNLNQRIISDSLHELTYILNWIRQREESADEPITVLIGGWAVHVYNPWYGSIDVDLVTNNKTKERLKHILIHERGFERYRVGGGNSVCKPTKYGQDIIIDFGNRNEHYKFEGRDEELNFDILDGNTVVRAIQGNVKTEIPKRSLLLLFKMKASWDRSYRINNQASCDLGYDRSKLVKDHADIIALLDPKKGGREIDISFLGKYLEKYPFLIDSLKSIPVNNEAIEMYGAIDKERVKDVISRLLLLLKPVHRTFIASH